MNYTPQIVVAAIKWAMILPIMMFSPFAPSQVAP